MTVLKLYTATRRFLVREEAPTMVEYGLLVALIAIVVAIAAAFLGAAISSLFQTVGGSIT